MDRKKLSVLVVTYNHEEYIAQSLDSILMQEHDFSFEIIVADDCSRDNTLKIVQEYKSLYPDLIRILETRTNLGITQNYKRGFDACTGEYVAVLEGDDYWTSSSRLKKLIGFLDNNQVCVVAFNRFVVANLQSKRYNVQPWPVVGEYQLMTVSDLVRDNFIGNFSTCVYRNDIISNIEQSLYEMKVYDWMFNIAMGQHGLIGYIPDVMSVYRLHPKGTWTQKNEEEKITETIQSIDLYNEYLGYVYDEEFKEHKSRLVNRLNKLRHPELLTKSEKLKTIIKMYTPPILLNIAKQIVPPEFWRRA